MFHSKSLKFLSLSLVILTWILILMGGLVTSHGAGLSVPDWPTTYGENMFTFHPAKWIGGIRFEHSHRLWASLVGLVTLVFTLLAFFKEKRLWVRRLSYFSFIAVVTQGMLGGLTVKYQLPDWMSVSHALLGQTFFVLTIWLCFAYFYPQTKDQNSEELINSFFPRSVFILSLILFASFYVQLFLGAWMRHSESGLAVFDFPSMGGSYIPWMTTGMLSQIENWRFEQGYEAVNSFQIGIHLSHRIGALVCSFVSIIFIWKVWFLSKTLKYFKVLLWAFIVLLIIQISLGAFVIWSQKAPWITSFHVVIGASVMALSFLLCLLTYFTCSRERIAS